MVSKMVSKNGLKKWSQLKWQFLSKIVVVPYWGLFARSPLCALVVLLGLGRVVS